MRTRARHAAVLAVATTLVGCQVHHAYGDRMRGVDLQARRHLHVVAHAKDTRKIGLAIGHRMTRSGFHVTWGPHTAAVPAEADAVVTYEDYWMFDTAQMSMYLMALRIDVRDPATNELLASGQSYRNPPARRLPRRVIDEVVRRMFRGG